MLKLTEDAHKSIANGKCVILVMLDFSNAYGMVDHNRLLQVLESIGITDNELNWFESFLTGWQQRVKFDNKFSTPQTIRRGIIQGENNSQLLFSIFINNITKRINRCKMTQFAGDTQI